MFLSLTLYCRQSVRLLHPSTQSLVKNESVGMGGVPPWLGLITVPSVGPSRPSLALCAAPGLSEGPITGREIFCCSFHFFENVRG